MPLAKIVERVKNDLLFICLNVPPSLVGGRAVQTDSKPKTTANAQAKARNKCQMDLLILPLAYIPKHRCT